VLRIIWIILIYIVIRLWRRIEVCRIRFCSKRKYLMGLKLKYRLNYKLNQKQQYDF